jgi:serine/threonine protein kinase
MWSVGCIFAELLARNALFPGEDYIAQLRLICEKMGRPPMEDLDFVTSERAKAFISSLPQNRPAAMSELFPAHKNETQAFDLLRRMLDFHPTRRITIEDALLHPFMASLHNAEDEPIADFTFDFAFEDDDLSRERVQALIWDEIRELHSDMPENCPTTNTPRRKKPTSMFPDAKADSKSEVDDEGATKGDGSPKGHGTRKRSASPEVENK